MVAEPEEEQAGLPAVPAGKLSPYVSPMMSDINQTYGEEFVLVGFSDLSNLRVPIFVGFLLLYLITVSGNLTVISVIYLDSHLHTPMYFFLTNLSFVDISYTSVMFPQMLASVFLSKTHITLQECLLQVYFFGAMIATEFLLLTIMSFDRYVAICNPLQYTMIMRRSVCLQMASGALILGFLEPIFHTALLSTFSFCKTHEINHFFCDIAILLMLSCTSTYTIETMTFILAVIVLIFSWTLIITSYIKIISAILKMQTTTQRQKAFSTCASHLTVVVLFYGAIMFVYVRPVSMYSVSESKMFFLVYTGVVPMCNPIIYTLKNKEFKDALKRRTGRRSQNIEQA
ncbi:olfactory receptor 5J3-like [Lissotriton helveticus]